LRTEKYGATVPNPAGMNIVTSLRRTARTSTVRHQVIMER
jgi:hypothetical protein